MAVISPASPSPRQELFTGLAWLAQRYHLRMWSHALDRTGYLAGDDERRAAELEWALASPGIDAIYCARGGYGILRVLERFDVLRHATSSPRWLIGFSDVTALHCELSRAGVASVHASNVTGLRRATARDKAALLHILERTSAPRAWRGLVLHVAGEAEGPLFGGNVALLEAMAAAGRLVVPEGAILLLEDVTERPYRIDRMLTSLRLGGHLARASAFVVGEFAQCEPGPDGVTVRSVLEERLSDYGVPVAFDAPFGHGAINHPFVVGERARLSGGELTFG